MSDIFGDNPMLIIALVVFVLCVIIGFFADRHLRKENKIGKILIGYDDISDSDDSSDQSKISDDTLKTGDNSTNSNNKIESDGNDKKDDHLNKAINDVIGNDSSISNNQNNANANAVVNNQTLNNQSVNNAPLNNQNNVNNTLPNQNAINNQISENIMSNPDDEINNMF